MTFSRQQGAFAGDYKQLEPRPFLFPLNLFPPTPTYSRLGTAMLTRRSGKRVLLGCVVALLAAIAIQAAPSLSLWLKDTLYFVETGSAASAVAILLALVATA